MNIGAQMAFPGAIIGSILVAFFGFMMTSDVKAEALPTPPPKSISAVVPQVVDATEQANENSEQTEEPSAANSEDLFEASIAFTPEMSADNVPAAVSSECRVSDRFPPSILQWCGYITSYAEQHNLPPNLIAAVMLQESGGQPLAYSHSGAVGLMQVMPRDGIAAKFMCKNGPCFTSRPTIAELQEPEFNVAYGTRMLSGLVGRFGNHRDALKSYGPMDVGYSYADKVLAIYDRYGQ